jgi:hypothetical protein
MPACTPDKAKGGMTPHHIHGEMKYGEKRNEGRRTQGWGRTHGGDGGARHEAPGAVTNGVEIQRRPLGDNDGGGVGGHTTEGRNSEVGGGGWVRARATAEGV